MEQPRCWMLTKRKHSLTSHLQASTPSSCDQSSWEEQAFAEDAFGMLGGCIWPPRSYSCSFCRREFRSAQALGGHMNVHRRDRARLKQSPPLPQNDQNHDSSPFQLPNTSSPLDFQYPNSHSQICTLLYSPNPNSDLISGQPSTSCSSKPSTNSDVNNFFPSFSSPTKRDREVSLRSSPSYYQIGIDRESDGIGILENLELGCKNDHVSSDVGEEEEGNHCKRRRISTPSSTPFFVKLNSVDRHHVPPESFEIGTCSKEELDLELRLGERPKVQVAVTIQQ